MVTNPADKPRKFFLNTDFQAFEKYFHNNDQRKLTNVNHKIKI